MCGCHRGAGTDVLTSVFRAWHWRHCHWQRECGEKILRLKEPIYNFETYYHHGKPKSISDVTLAESNGWGCLSTDFLLKGSPSGLIFTRQFGNDWCDPGLKRWQVDIGPQGDPLSRKSINKHPHPLISARVTWKIFVGLTWWWWWWEWRFSIIARILPPW